MAKMKENLKRLEIVPSISELKAKPMGKTTLIKANPALLTLSYESKMLMKKYEMTINDINFVKYVGNLNLKLNKANNKINNSM